MQTNGKRILAIDPGTRWMGVALLDNGRLAHHAVMVIAKEKSPRETLQRAKDVVARLIDEFDPQIVAVEKTFFSKSRNATTLNALFDEIKSITKRRRLEFVSYAPSTVKKFTCGNGWASKKEVATVVVSKYPELRVFLTQDRAWKERFHQNMFDAVAIGLMAATRTTESRRAKAYPR